MSSNRHSSYKIPMSMLEPDDELDRPLPRSHVHPFGHTEPAIYTPAFRLPSATQVGSGSTWVSPFTRKLDRTTSTAAPRIPLASNAPFVPQHSKIGKGKHSASIPIGVGSAASLRDPSSVPDHWSAASGNTLVNDIDDFETEPFPLDILPPLPLLQPEPNSSTTFTLSSTFSTDTQVDARDLVVPENFFEDGSPSPVPQHRTIPADGVPPAACGEAHSKLINDVPLCPISVCFEDAVSNESDACVSEEYEEDNYEADDYVEEDEYEEDYFEEGDEVDEDDFEEKDEYEEDDYAEDEHKSVASSHEAIDIFSDASLSQEDKHEAVDEEKDKEEEYSMDPSAVPTPTDQLSEDDEVAGGPPVTNPFYQFPFTPGDPKHWADMTAQLEFQSYIPSASAPLPDEATRISAQHTRWPSQEPGPEVEPLWRASKSGLDDSHSEINLASARAVDPLPSERTDASIDAGKKTVDPCPTMHATRADVLVTHESSSSDLSQTNAMSVLDDSKQMDATPVRSGAMSEPTADTATPGLSQEAKDTASGDNNSPVSTQSSLAPQTPPAPALADLPEVGSPPQILGKRSVDEIDDPASVPETPPQQRRRGPAGQYLGAFALGAAFGAVGTIAGLMQLAPQ